MSILSSEKYYGPIWCVEIEESINSVDVFFFPNNNRPVTNVSTASTSIIYNTAALGNQIVVNNNTFSTTGNSVDSSHQLVGLRLSIDGQNLKIFKKEIPYYGLIASNTYVEASKYIMESPCYPTHLFASVGDVNLLNIIQHKVISLFSRHGIIVPSKFVNAGYAESNLIMNLSCASINWLYSPLVRETDSLDVATNLSTTDLEIICPNYTAMNFKEIVEHYYGTSTKKMLEEIWNVILHGRVAIGPIVDGSYAKNVLFNDVAFNVGPAIFKTMGFDYFYQFIANVKNMDPSHFRYGVATVLLEDFIKVLLKYVGPKRIINLLSVSTLLTYDFQDIVKMLKDYDTAEKIPNSLKHLYPDGLTINFNFKDVKELHDKISTQYTIIKAEADKKDIPVHPTYMKLNGKESGGFKLVVPTNTAFLSIWGKSLNICIASYGNKAVKGETLLLGVEKEGIVKYCVEFRSFAVPEPGIPDPVVLPGAIIGVEQNMITVPDGFNRKALPMVREEMAQTPSDVTDEEGLYYIPAIVQFRGEKNSDPTAEDRSAIENILCDWVSENKEEYGLLTEKFGKEVYSGAARLQFAGNNIGAINHINVPLINNMVYGAI